MPYYTTVAGDIQQCFPDFATARSDIQELRNQGQKPRLYYSTSFAHLGCEIDDNGVRIPDYTNMQWCDYAKLLPHFASSWSITDDELSNDRYRLVDVYAQLSGREYHLADMAYARGEITPKDLRVNTCLIRVIQGLMDPNDL